MRLVVRRQGAWAGRKGAMEWRMALLVSNMASPGHTSGETHKGGSKGPFLTRISASSSARVRARLALHAPTPAFGRRRSWPLADRDLRPPSTVDRGLRPPPQIVASRSVQCRSISSGRDHPSSERQQACAHAAPVPSNDNTASNGCFSSKARFSAVTDGL